MSDALPDAPDLDPSTLAGTSFDRSRKGFEPTEVRSLLGRTADALRVWADRDAQLVRRVEDLSRRLDQAEEYDEARVTEVLGAETARIVTAARSAAAEIREHAESESTQLLETSWAEAEAKASRLVSEAVTDREAAESARSEAEASASEIVSAATATAERVVGEAEAEAERLTSGANQRHDEMVEAASAVLAERTAEAEDAAVEIAAAAEAELEAARTGAAEELRSARAEAERLRSEAQSAATEELEAAREEGREMVAEARDVRQRMLRDLAERSRLGRQKVEAAKASRSGVMEAIRAAAGQLEETLGELDDSDHEIARIADTAAAAVPDDADTVVRELEAELEGEGTELHEVVAEEAVHTGEGEPDRSLETVAEEVGSEELGSEGAEPQESVEPGAAEPDQVEPTEENQMASVHDLFERLRSGDEGSEHPTSAAVTAAAGAVGPVDEGPADEGPADEGADAPGTDGGGSEVLDHSESIDLTPDESPSAPEAPTAVSGPDVTEVGSEPTEPASVPAASASTSTSGAVALVVQEAQSIHAASPDASFLDRRDELLAPSERLLARNLKRLVGDEQNEVLDRARRIKRQRPELNELLGEDATDAYASALAEPYLLAAAAGAQMWCEMSDAEMVQPEADDVAEALHTQVSELLELRRVHVREALENHDRSGADVSELVDQMRAAYRELRATSVPELAADLAAGGFTGGSRRAAGSRDTWRWIPDNGGLPCADAEDNALAGALACGAEFPTGDIVPPAHPGCRCIVVRAT